ncbi:MAG: M48 family metalloprotease [Acidobacteriota bacterium]|nr:M48 family metalloprotease [Acidobacteriota bacterium]
MTARTRPRLQILGCAVLVVLLAACAVNPVSGRKELSFFSEAQEIALGEQTDREIRSQFGVYDDPKLNAYFASVGAALAPYTHRPHLTYHFAVLDTPVVNAFAVPGGYIYITRGALAMMISEAEMATVLGHELGHVNARHSIRKLSGMILVQAGLAVGSALSETFAKVAGVAGIGVQLLFLKYSRDDEREADALGVDYARRGGYNPAEMVGFFGSLEKLGDLSGNRHALPGFLSTHPLTKERIKNVQAMIEEDDARLPINQDAYLRRIDNMIYGEDPRQGYVENAVFYHPDLRFQVAIPQGWTVQNTPSRVAMVSKDENAALLLQLEKTGLAVEEYAGKKAEEIEGRKLIREEGPRSISGLTFIHRTYDVPQGEQEALRVRLSFVRKKDFIYTFSALSSVSGFPKYEGTFQSAVASFRELTDRRYIDRQPIRIRLVTADGKTPLNAIFAAAGMPEDVRPKFAVVNAYDLKDTPKRGQIIKVAR